MTEAFTKPPAEDTGKAAEVHDIFAHNDLEISKLKFELKNQDQKRLPSSMRSSEK